jgi:tetratricopeptide (TPR) repeat protein
MKEILFICFFLSHILQGSMLAQEVIKKNIAEEYQLGMEAVAASRFEKATMHFYECVRSEPRNPAYLERLGYVLTQTGKFKDARLYYQTMLKVDSTDTKALLALGRLYDKEQNPRKAREFYLRLLTIDTTNAYFYQQNGYSASKVQDFIGAISYFSKAHELNPEDIVVIDELIQLYLQLDRIPGTLDYAAQMAKQGMALDSNNLRILYSSARVANKQRDYPTVVRLLEKAQSLGDSLSYFQLMLGAAYLQEEKPEQAIFQLENLLAKGENTERVHHYLAIAYRDIEENEKSRMHYEKAIEKGISKQVPTYYEELGDMSMTEGKTREAIEAYREAYALNPKPKLMYFLAYLSDQYYKDKSIALRYFEKYLASGDQEFREYALARAQQLKEYLHQKGK